MDDAGFAGYVDFLLKTFPEARIVFNTRNADSVAQSAWLKEKPAAAVHRMVETCDRRFKDALKAHPDRCFLVEYEAFTADPGRYGELCGFLDLPYVPEKIAQVLEKPLLHAQGKHRTEAP